MDALFRMPVWDFYLGIRIGNLYGPVAGRRKAGLEVINDPQPSFLTRSRSNMGRCITGYFATSRCGRVCNTTHRCGIGRLSRCERSCGITTPSKIKSFTTSYFELNRCGRNCGTTNPSKRNSSATSHFELSRCGRNCGTTNPSKRNSSATVPVILQHYDPLWNRLVHWPRRP